MYPEEDNGWKHIQYIMNVWSYDQASNKVDVGISKQYVHLYAGEHIFRDKRLLQSFPRHLYVCSFLFFSSDFLFDSLLFSICMKLLVQAVVVGWIGSCCGQRRGEM